MPRGNQSGSQTETMTAETLHLVLRLQDQVAEQITESLSRVHTIANAQLAELRRLISQRIHHLAPAFLHSLQGAQTDNISAIVEVFCYNVGLEVLKEQRAKLHLTDTEMATLAAAHDAAKHGGPPMAQDAPESGGQMAQDEASENGKVGVQDAAKSEKEESSVVRWLKWVLGRDRKSVV